MQPYFFPYIGYFQLMAKVDKFVLYDDVNFIKRGWINRNRIKINGAAHFVTIPLQQSSQNKLICDIDLDPGMEWRKKMLKTIAQAYARSGNFNSAFELIEKVILYPQNNLADFLCHSLLSLRDYLGLEVEIVESSRKYGNAERSGSSRIVDICEQEGATTYINPIGGMALYESDDFSSRSMDLFFLDPVVLDYTKNKSGFLPGLSMIDVIMNNDRNSVMEMLASGILLQK